ncbi:MAG TPA: hypothetical protein VFQ61_25155 [Polyangiaceae bacterium]|nr:hypothetical protein [Polyangiaceae bacterium]
MWRRLHSDQRWERPLLLEGVAGLATPVGFAGVMVESSTPFFAASAGTGLGFTGIQLAAQARLRLPLGGVAPYAGLGFSVGPFARLRPFSCCSGDPTLFMWLNTELGVEGRDKAGTNVRVFVGLGQSVDPVVLPYVGVAVGHAFSFEPKSS